MTTDERRLLALLPALYRLRDVELASRMPRLLTPSEEAELRTLAAGPGPLDDHERRRLDELRAKRDRGPLAAFLRVLAREVDVLEENLTQLYDDLFVETADPWVLPYLGDLIGYRLLGEAATDRRAEIAHTIGFRRRKGTAAMLEQLARDVTGADARAVEYFTRLATTQHLNHPRLANRVAPSVRDGEALQRVGGAFDEIPRTLDVRRIETGAGRYNIPNVGVFLWRLPALRHEGSPATPHHGGGRRFRFHPLGIDQQLVGRPVPEEEIGHLAGPEHVPAPISRRRLLARPHDLVGPELSLEITVDGRVVLPGEIVAATLEDSPSGWMHDAPVSKVAIDPELGRLVTSQQATSVTAMFHVAGVPDAFGGTYSRAHTFALPGPATLRVPQDHGTIQDALDALGGAGVVEITDSGRYPGALAVAAEGDSSVELRAADGQRPTLELNGPLTVTGAAGSHVHLNGLLVVGDGIAVASGDGLTLFHCTLVPGRTLSPDLTPAHPGLPSLTLSAPTEVTVDRCVLGPLRVTALGSATVRDSVIDAGDVDAEAYGEGGSPGGRLTLEGSTMIGRVHTTVLTASSSILLGDVTVVRRQEGCLRFSFAPPRSVVPRRYRSQPADGGADVPHFTSLRFGHPAYARLAARTPESVLRGGEGHAEMGAFHWRVEQNRQADLLTRFDEYLRVGLGAGVFHES